MRQFKVDPEWRWEWRSPPRPKETLPATAYPSPPDAMSTLRFTLPNGRVVKPIRHPDNPRFVTVALADGKGGDIPACLVQPFTSLYELQRAVERYTESKQQKHTTRRAP
jgi:hypothetical protein